MLHITPSNLVDNSTNPAETMNLEYNRLLSFNDWPSQVVSDNPDANPSTLAKYGFYYQPKGETSGYNAKNDNAVKDQTIQFCCKVLSFSAHC